MGGGSDGGGEISIKIKCKHNTLARDLTIGLSIIPLRKIRSISLAPVEIGNSLRLSNTCCIAEEDIQMELKIKDQIAMNNHKIRILNLLSIFKLRYANIELL